jgi:hypothetical protein
MSMIMIMISAIDVQLSRYVAFDDVNIAIVRAANGWFTRPIRR